MQNYYFKDGLTVKELKDLVKDWSDVDEYGEPCEVWVGDKIGFSNQVRAVCPLNYRVSDSGLQWSDLILEF